MNLKLLLFVLISACIPRPSDPIAIGDLCEPETSKCPNSVLLVREGVGRNQLDYTIENLGSTEVDVNVIAVTPDTTTVDLDTINPDLVIARQNHPRIEAGKSVGNRLTPKLLGTRDSLRLFTFCTKVEKNEKCSIKLEYVFESVPVECFDDTDCSSGWLCDANIGHCTECLTSSDCNTDQTCDSIRGRCTPEDVSPSCATIAPSTSLLFIVLFFLLLFRRRVTKGRKHHLWSGFWGLAFLIGFNAIPLSAHADPSAGVSLGVGMRSLLGELGKDAQRGIGLRFGQELRWKHLGIGVQLGTSFYQTSQTPPPFSKGLITYTIAVGPRTLWGFGKHELVLFSDLRRVGFLNNSLVRVTGTKSSFTAFGLGLGYRYHLEKAVVEFETTVAPFIDLDGTTLLFDISIGFGSGY